MTDHPLTRRVAAAQATLDEFKDRPFRWGQTDCARMVAAHLRRMGYKVRLPAKGSYASPRSAMKKLKERGFDRLDQALDAIGLERIAPASAIVGDIVQGASGDAFGALGVLLGNGRIVGYHEDAPGPTVLQVVEIDVAWRVQPKQSRA